MAGSLYEDIARRTGGDIYIGVVGPVRTGKSTFIQKFMEELVIPSIDNVYRRERARDELPQSGAGKTVMTAEPKFVPEEAVEIAMGPAKLRVRLIDSVGYLVPGAIGATEDGEPRMVTTSWFPEPVPMERAAEEGTRRVIRDHATIGLVVTTDGTVTDIPRGDYVESEERAVRELKALGKPFVLLVNSRAPGEESAQKLTRELSEKYGVTARCEDVSKLDREGIDRVIRSVLMEFPVTEVRFRAPEWAVGNVRDALAKTVLESAKSLRRVAELESAVARIGGDESVEGCKTERINLGDGSADVKITLPRAMFYGILSEQSGFDVKSDADLPPLLSSLAAAKRRYDRVAEAMQRVDELGYGIVPPDAEEMTLAEPEIVRQSGRFGVKLRASAPSIHMMRVMVSTEISPLVGGERASEEFAQSIASEYEENADKLWESNIFGKSLHDLVAEGLNQKLGNMPDEAQEKLRGTLERIINEGAGGMICILV